MGEYEEREDGVSLHLAVVCPSKATPVARQPLPKGCSCYWALGTPLSPLGPQSSRGYSCSLLLLVFSISASGAGSLKPAHASLNNPFTTFFSFIPSEWNFVHLTLTERVKEEEFLIPSRSAEVAGRISDRLFMDLTTINYALPMCHSL